MLFFSIPFLFYLYQIVTKRDGYNKINKWTILAKLNFIKILGNQKFPA